MTARKKRQSSVIDIRTGNKQAEIPTLATPKSKLRPEHLVKYNPLNEIQGLMYSLFNTEQHIVADGCPGTGKTFIALYLALQEVVVKRKQTKIVIVRSIVPTRDIGFLPGSIEEKIAVYEQPYRDIMKQMIVPSIPDAYGKCREQGILEFMPTSFIRGTTIDDAIIIVDEIQNMTVDEASSVLTRVGQNSRLVLCGDYYQSDLQRKRENERSGYQEIKRILKSMKSVSFVEFTDEEIVRSGFVKEFIKAKIKLGYQK